MNLHKSPISPSGALRALLTGVAGAVVLAVLSSEPSSAAERGGQIRGEVSLPSGGRPIGLRIKARNARAEMTWNVFSRRGEYRVPTLPAGTYQVWISERGFDSVPQTVEVRSGQSLRLDLTATSRKGFDVSQQFRPRDPHVNLIDETLPLVDFDEVYPDRPGRAELIDHCFACHGTIFHHMRLDRPGWEYMVNRMIDREHMEGEPKRNIIYRKATFPEKDRVAIIDYLSDNFAPAAPMKDIRLDELIPDEDVISEAVYVEYDVPLTDRTQRPRSYHDPYIAPNGDVWVNDRANRSLVHIDPQALDAGKRVIEEHTAPWPDTSMHGITIDSKGRVYYADINGGYLGEWDPATRSFKRYETTGNMEPPWNVPPGVRTPESAVQIVVDKDDNVWGNLVSGEKIFRLDARTRQIRTWPLPTPDSNPYGMIARPDGTIWTAGISSDRIIGFDPRSERFVEFKTPTQPSAPRRLDDDAQGNIWWAEYTGGHLGMVDPKTGTMAEYAFPLKFTRGYDAWVVGDHIWITEAEYQTLVRFDLTTKTFVYYPLPMAQPSGNPGVPKLEVGKDGTLWFAYRGLRGEGQQNPVVAFKPKGNAGDWGSLPATRPQQHQPQ